MPPKPAPKPALPTPVRKLPLTANRLPLAKHQSFTYEEINREQLQGAPYNPRRISEPARKRLRQSLERNGLVEPIVWNRRTGHVVGGHQRLSQLDSLEGHPRYRVGVAVIDLDAKQERALNVMLNNPHAQGLFEPGLMLDLLKLPDAPSLEDMGLTRGELEMEIGSLPELDDLFPQATRAQKDARELSDIDRIKQESLAIGRDERAQDRANRKDGQPASADADAPMSHPNLAKRKAWQAAQDAKPEKDTDYFLLLRFESSNQKEQFLDHAGLPIDTSHLDAGIFNEMLRPEYADWQTAAVGKETDA